MFCHIITVDVPKKAYNGAFKYCCGQLGDLESKRLRTSGPIGSTVLWFSCHMIKWLFIHRLDFDLADKSLLILLIFNSF